jgi:hypothetical protein
MFSETAKIVLYMEVLATAAQNGSRLMGPFRFYREDEPQSESAIIWRE